ncbi:hypothetical protein HanXRQr2_Chr11g0470831 [Helianthus annuus]|uniref:Uncharacterized protein n=1 Tax=Helianthus annuus TaxID=4232 RepID=A0A9K3HLJ0_HELAN|nr:hypothetical protein HanXRQr2_Chr11g0470831 [Helianthus annuus]KAJ0873565.1 hypothetical protein HanPSC8_Chr11g0453911 [Helianthus annuus]
MNIAFVLMYRSSCYLESTKIDLQIGTLGVTYMNIASFNIGSLYRVCVYIYI